MKKITFFKKGSAAKDWRSKSGFGLVEIVVVSGVIVLVISALMYAASTYIKFSIKNTAGIKAGYLLEEGVEAVKIMRDASWDTKIATATLGTDYYLVFSSNTWDKTSTPSAIDGAYYRTINFAEAFRDANDDFDVGGTTDADARLVTVEVSWFDRFANATTTKTISTYVVNLFDN